MAKNAGFARQLAFILIAATIVATTANNTSIHEPDAYGYPTWMSVSNRMLLASEGNIDGMKPNAVVAVDDSGDYKSISDAVNSISGDEGKYMIYVKPGEYNETVRVERKNVFLYGADPLTTIIRGNKSEATGTETDDTATFTVSASADGFIARGISFINDAGPQGKQAVALRVDADRAAFLYSYITGYQAVLYANSNRQFYRECHISGTIDIIFGDATAIFQRCHILARLPSPGHSNVITAHGRRNNSENTAFVLHGCMIQASPELKQSKARVPTYLGRPWKPFARTIVMESDIGDLISPEGWLQMENSRNHETCYYAEYNNSGPGADTAGRVQWPGVNRSINQSEAMNYTVGNLLDGDSWLPATKVTYDKGLCP